MRLLVKSLRHLSMSAILYHIYAEIISRLTVDQDRRPLPPIPCQFCGGNHTERLCPKAKELGF